MRRCGAATGRHRRPHLHLVLLFGMLAAAGAADVGAQNPQRLEASPSLAGDHWAVEAARRAEALGLIERYLPAQRAVPRQVVASALEEAAARAEREHPALVELTAAWRDRFVAEFGAPGRTVPGTRLRALGNAANLELAEHAGRAAAGTGIFPENKTGASPLPAGTELQGRVSLAVGFGGFLAAEVEPQFQNSDIGVYSWEVVLGWSALGLSVGRKPVAYGYGPQGIVLSGAAPVDRIQLETVRPFRLPGPLTHLGDVAVHGFMSRLREPRHPGDPYLWGIAGSLRPHPRVTLSIHRASILGGDSVATPLTARNLFRTFIGHNLLDFENEVVAGHLRVRLPTEGLMPITLYGEWGAEDAAGAWRDVPGRLAGVYVPAVPGFPAAAMGIEYASFAESCCGNPPWYRHSRHLGGWADADRPLGHELGGQGRQATAYAHLDLWRAALRIDGRLFTRQRTGENLYVPGREGASRGIGARSAWRVVPQGELGIAAEYERAATWTERSLSLGGRAYF